MSKKLLESYNQQQELNRTLEIKVEERTADLQEAKKTIEASHKSMEDSIKFASLIQTAILPAPAILDSYTSENFILWQPKDTVGGDIYLTMELDDEVFILVFDGAGHGVHGAFVTMLVKAIENQLSAKLKSGEIEKSPAKMLEYFNIAFKLMLKQDKQFHSRKDNISNAGFDGAILYYKRGSKQLIFSGAKSQVFTLNGESIEMYKGDRANVGFFRTKMNQKFSDKIIPLEDNTTIYITTDGYLDQWVPEKENIFGSDSFSELILENRNTPLQEQRAVFTDTLESLLLNGEQIDDITVIALKF
jgi:serine phosphatase RsbU (regulator of sigma subunit)